jgi:GNAT superfamily N-acetyltransferase
VDIVTLAERPDLETGMWELTRAWPAFMLNDLVADLYYANLDVWAEHALLCVVDGAVVARGFSVAFALGGADRTGLPSDGWDGVVRWSYLDRVAGRDPTHASALEVTIAPEARGQGLSTAIVSAMIGNVRRLGFDQLFAPVRPSSKHLEPDTPMEEYIARTRLDGLPEDPWMRVHARLGAVTLAVCPTSMVIAGTLAEWREWTGLEFATSGPQHVPGALVPVHVDGAQNHAVYVEPNVWMEHRW